MPKNDILTEKPARQPNAGTWKKGQSGNPKGGLPDPGRREAIDILKANAPAVIEKALKMVLCKNPNTAVMRAIIQKIFPDNLNLSGGENPLLILIEKVREKILIENK